MLKACVQHFGAVQCAEYVPLSQSSASTCLELTPISKLSASLCHRLDTSYISLTPSLSFPPLLFPSLSLSLSDAFLPSLLQSSSQLLFLLSSLPSFYLSPFFLEYV